MIGIGNADFILVPATDGKTIVSQVEASSLIDALNDQ
jgi:hypothetical protein